MKGVVISNNEEPRAMKLRTLYEYDGHVVICTGLGTNHQFEGVFVACPTAPEKVGFKSNSLLKSLYREFSGTVQITQ